MSAVPFPLLLLERLRRAGRVAVLTGAGISAESGIPTFRDAQTGLWARYHPEELATPQAFRRQPHLVWEWYAWRRQLCANKQPNPGHLALAQLADYVPHLHLITQNVDGLHQRAGTPQVIELHGNLHRFKCLEQQHPVTDWPDAGPIPPRCPHCGGLVRPDVVWFGESLPQAALAQATTAAQSCDLFLTVGTSSLVYPAAWLPQLAQQAGAWVVEINPNRTPLTPLADYVLSGPAGQVLPALLAHTWPER